MKHLDTSYASSIMLSRKNITSPAARSQKEPQLIESDMVMDHHPASSGLVCGAMNRHSLAFESIRGSGAKSSRTRVERAVQISAEPHVSIWMWGLFTGICTTDMVGFELYRLHRRTRAMHSLFRSKSFKNPRSGFLLCCHPPAFIIADRMRSSMQHAKQILKVQKLFAKHEFVNLEGLRDLFNPVLQKKLVPSCIHPKQ